MQLSSQKTPHSRFLSTMSGETLVFLTLLISIALAGFNSGNNLLYLIAGVMLGSLCVSWIAGRINLKGLEAKRRIPNYVFAARPFRIGLELFNKKRFFGSFGITLEETSGDHRTSFFMSVGKRCKQEREIEVSLARRGLHRFPPMKVSSKFPWGLFTLRRKIADRREVVVYPHIYDLTKVVAGKGHLQDEFPKHRKGPGSGLYGLREYRHGEEASSICWKLSAKLDRLIIRETECEERRRVCIVFDNTLRDRSGKTLDAFENAVSAAASLVWYLSRNGYSVKLITRDKIVGYGEGLDHMHRMLITLALIEGFIPKDGEETAIHTNMFEGGTGVLVAWDKERVAICSTDGNFDLVIPETMGARMA